jgi:hypothetical protein
MWEEIKDLPVEVTRNNVPIFKVQPVTVGDLKVAEKISKKIAEENEDAVRDMYPLGYCNFPFCNKFAVATKDGKNYCKEHNGK